MSGKVTVLSFIYRTCDDVNGCPLSTMVLYTLAKRLDKLPEIKDSVRLLTVSFDPQFDTPAVMANYRESIVGKHEMDWLFLTSESEAHIAPILADYNQMVIKDNNLSFADEEPRNTFSHILRVYLIDPKRNIRNIYNLSFLHPDILINDVQTLLLEK